MADSATRAHRFRTLTGVPLEAAFDAGRLTSDGGLPWLAEADQALGLCAALAACVPDWRRGPVRHALETLVRQRVYQIACGYEDQNDATTLRSDPLLQLVCGRLPLSGADLASQPTLSRLEQVADRHLAEMGSHGFYRQHMYFPLLVFDGDTGQLITAVLRPGNVHGSRFVVLVLRRLLKRLRAAWPAERRVVFKAEALAKGPNTRFVLTTRTDAPMTVYDWYVDRGEPENWIKDFKNALRADHLHDHRFWSNAFRLLLHAAAYWLLDTLRRWLAATAPA